MPFALVLIERGSQDSEKVWREFGAQISLDEFTLDTGVYTLNGTAWLFDLSMAMEKYAKLIVAADKLKLHVLHLSNAEIRMAMVSTPKSVKMDQFLKPRRANT